MNNFLRFLSFKFRLIFLGFLGLSLGFRVCGESSGGRFREGLTTKVVPVSPPENVFFCVAVFFALRFFALQFLFAILGLRLVGQISEGLS